MAACLTLYGAESGNYNLIESAELVVGARTNLVQPPERMADDSEDVSDFTDDDASVASDFADEDVGVASDFTDEDVDVAYELQLSEAIAASQRDAWHLREAQQSEDEEIALALAIEDQLRASTMVQNDAHLHGHWTKVAERSDEEIAIALALEDQVMNTTAAQHASHPAGKQLGVDESVAIWLASSSQDTAASSSSTSSAHRYRTRARRYADEQQLHFPSVCTICLDRKPASDFVVLEACSHRFCTGCLSRYLETKIGSAQVPAPCPQQGCPRFMGRHDYSLLTISDGALAKLTNLEVVASIPDEEKYYCPFPDCSALMTKPSQGDPDPGHSLFGGLFRGRTVGGRDGISSTSSPGRIGAVECFSCHRLFCAECHVPWHPRYSCAQFQKLTPEEMKNSDSEYAFKQLVRDKKWMTCVKCGHIVERVEGCSHITCRCGYQFCYHCGRKWKLLHLCL